MLVLIQDCGLCNCVCVRERGHVCGSVGPSSCVCARVCERESVCGCFQERERSRVGNQFDKQKTLKSVKKWRTHLKLLFLSFSLSLSPRTHTRSLSLSLSLFHLRTFHKQGCRFDPERSLRLLAEFGQQVFQTKFFRSRNWFRFRNRKMHFSFFNVTFIHFPARTWIFKNRL